MKQHKDCVSLDELIEDALVAADRETNKVYLGDVYDLIRRAYELGRQQEADMWKLAQIDQEIEAENAK